MNKQKVLASAEKYVSKGQLAKAVREYQRVLAEEPHDVRIRLKVGDIYAKLGNVDEAINAFEAVAQHHAGRGFLSKAVAVYKRILQLAPENIMVHHRLAEAYFQLGRLSDAIAYYNAVAQIMLQRGDSDGYTGTLRQMLSIDPENIGIRIKLAEHFSKEDRSDNAIEEFSLAAQQLRASGRIDDYIKVAERLVFLQPDAHDRIKNLVRVYLERGDGRRALAKLQHCFKHDPHDVETLGLLVEVFRTLGQTEKALQVLREKARVLSRLGQADEAKRAWKQILGNYPEDKEANEALAVAEESQAPVLDSDLLDPLSQSIDAGPVPPPPVPRPQQTYNTPAPRPISTPMAERSSLTPPSSPPGPTTRPASAPPSAPAPDPAAHLYNEDPEIQRLLVETDVYIKYGLFDQAFEHLRKVFLIDPNNLDAMERIKEIHYQSGYYPQAVDELLRMARICYPSDPERGKSYLKEGLQIMPHNEASLLLLAEWGLEWDDLFPPLGEALPDDAFPDLASVDAMLAQFAAEDEQIGAEPISNDAALTGQFLMPKDLEERLTESQWMNAMEAEGDVDVDIDVDIDAGASVAVEEYSHGAPAPDESLISVDNNNDFEDATAMFTMEQFMEMQGGAQNNAVNFAQHAPPAEHESTIQNLQLDPMQSAQLSFSRDESLPDDLSLDLAESDFYFHQGLYDEARTTLANIYNRWPTHPAVLNRIKALDEIHSLQEEVPSPNSGDTPPPPSPMTSPGSHDAIDPNAPLTESALPVALYEDPEMSPHLELGLAFRQMGLYQDAVDEFQAAAQAGQEIAQSLFWMGQCYLENEDAPQAIALFEQASQYVHSAADLLLHIDYRLGLSYERLGQYEMALGYFQKLAERLDLFPDVHQRVARLVAA